MNRKRCVTEESKPHQIAYNTLLFYYLHPLKRPNSFLVKPKLQNRKSYQTTARYMEEASLLSFPFPSCPASFLLFSPQPPCNTKRPLWWRELWSHFIIAGIIYHCCRYFLCNLFIMQGYRCITRGNASMQISARKFAVLRFEGYMLCCLQSEIPFFIDNVWTKFRHANKACFVRCPCSPRFLSARPNYAELFLECIMFTLKR